MKQNKFWISYNDFSKEFLAHPAEPKWKKDKFWGDINWESPDATSICSMWAKKLFGATNNPRDLIEVTFKVGPTWEPVE